MECINPDGSLSPSARAICASLIQPGSLDKIAHNTNMPGNRVLSCLQKLVAAGLVIEKQGIYHLSDVGLALSNP
jgi:predicted transcriptional regulator